MVQGVRAGLIAGLQSDILRLQGFKPFLSAEHTLGLGPVEHAFPEGSFPVAAIHEYLFANKEDHTATCGFIAGLLSKLVGQSTAVWIGSNPSIFPPALKSFGVQPDRCIFINVLNEKEGLWVLEESLKCAALTAVVAEVKDLTFTESRRLQLAVEESKVTGLIIRPEPKKISPTATVARWKITSLPSETPDNLPGLGYPQWRVELLKVRNGKPGAWQMEWRDDAFYHQPKQAGKPLYITRKAG